MLTLLSGSSKAKSLSSSDLFMAIVVRKDSFIVQRENIRWVGKSHTQVLSAFVYRKIALAAPDVSNQVENVLCFDWW